MAVQNGWCRCSLCQGLWFAGDITEAGRIFGACPSAAGRHRAGDIDYALVAGARPPDDAWEGGWFRCTRCGVLFAGRSGSACPARGGREHLAGAAYCVATRRERLYDPEPDWYRCTYCQGLYLRIALPPGTPDPSRCPGRATGLGHEPADDLTHYLLRGVGSAVVVGQTFPPPTDDDIPPQYPTLPVHAALLPLGGAGKVLYFAGTNFGRAHYGDRTFLWDPTIIWDPTMPGRPEADPTRGSAQIPTFQPGGPLPVNTNLPPGNGHDLFCSGHVLLADGSVLAAGGTGDDPSDIRRPPDDVHVGHWLGLEFVAVFTLDFEHATGRWWRAPDMLQQPARTGGFKGGRWYPSLLALADGTAVMLGGHPKGTDERHTNWWIERYVPGRPTLQHDPTVLEAGPQPKASKEPSPGRAKQLVPNAAQASQSNSLLTLDARSILGSSVPRRPLEADPRAGRWEYLGNEPLPVTVASNNARLQLETDAYDGMRSHLLQFGTPELYPRLFALPDGDVLCTRLVGLRGNATSAPPGPMLFASDFEDRTWRFNPFVAPSLGEGPLSTWRVVCVAPRDLPPMRQRDIDDGMVSEPAYSMHFHLESAALLPLREREGFDTSVLQVGGLAPWRLDLGPRAERAVSEWRRSGWRLLRTSRPRTAPASPTEALRRHCTAVLTPDARVLVIGGNDADGYGFTSDNPATPGVRAVEQYDPVEERWSILANLTTEHSYHHTALLLPDGRLWVAGDVRNSGYPPQIEAFSPPYLFRRPAGQRPSITSLSATRLAPGDTLTIYTPTPSTIEAVALMRCGSVTHGFDGDQRHIAPEFRARGRNWITIQLPDAFIMIPGWYMVFILDYLEVPSHATFLQVVPSFGPLVGGG